MWMRNHFSFVCCFQPTANGNTFDVLGESKRQHKQTFDERRNVFIFGTIRKTFLIVVPKTHSTHSRSSQRFIDARRNLRFKSICKHTHTRWTSLESYVTVIVTTPKAKMNASCWRGFHAVSSKKEGWKNNKLTFQKAVWTHPSPLSLLVLCLGKTSLWTQPIEWVLILAKRNSQCDVSHLGHLAARPSKVCGQ